MGGGRGVLKIWLKSPRPARAGDLHRGQVARLGEVAFNARACTYQYITIHLTYTICWGHII
jgi:hypothetical protein